MDYPQSSLTILFLCSFLYSHTSNLISSTKILLQ